MDADRLSPRQITVRRAALGLTQRELARITGVPQSVIAAAETGSRALSAAADESLSAVLIVRPSLIVKSQTAAIKGVFRKYGVKNPRVYGSIARGTDTVSSDADFLGTFPDDASLFLLSSLESDLEDLLTVPVDVVADWDSGGVLRNAVGESVEL